MPYPVADGRGGQHRDICEHVRSEPAETARYVNVLPQVSRTGRTSRARVNPLIPLTSARVWRRDADLARGLTLALPLQIFEI